MISFPAVTLGKDIKMKEFDFDGLFILDLANNHQGELDHGLNIINAGVLMAEYYRRQDFHYLELY